MLKIILNDRVDRELACSLRRCGSDGVDECGSCAIKNNAPDTTQMVWETTTTTQGPKWFGSVREHEQVGFVEEQNARSDPHLAIRRE